MFTVALIGLDGVGKTSVARLVAQDFPAPLRYVYMGDNVESSNVTLPTMRWWRKRYKRGTPAPRRADARPPAHPLRRVRYEARKTLGMLHRVLEASYRERTLSQLKRRGTIVLLDRHFTLDYYAQDHAPHTGARPWQRRIESAFRTRVLRLPDLVILLDAPGHVAYARKGEFTPEFLEQRRSEYLQMQGIIRNFEIVDATRALPEVAAEVAARILRFRSERLAARHPAAAAPTGSEESRPHALT